MLLVVALVLMVVQDLAPGRAALPIGVSPGRVTGVPDASPLVDVTLCVLGAGPEVYETLRFFRSADDRRWRLAEISRGVGERQVVRAPAGGETLLVLRTSARPGYLIDGPFRWPSQPASYVIPPEWRRTVRGRAARGQGGPLVWIAASDEPARDGWPACSWLDAQSWECIAVPLGAPGVIVGRDGAEVRVSIAAGPLTRPGIEDVADARAIWGKLVIVDTSRIIGIKGLVPLQGSARRASASADHDQPVRLETAPDPAIRVTPIGARGFWVSGTDTRADSWIEIRGRGLAPIRIDVESLAASPAEFPLRVGLDPAVEVSGRVTAGPDVPASGTRLALFRFARPRVDPRREPRRILVAEVVADEEGRFRFEEVGRERYELIARHPTLGRSEFQFDPDGQELEVALGRRPSHRTSPSESRGRHGARPF